jgi:hypothetical protein
MCGFWTIERRSSSAKGAAMLFVYAATPAATTRATETLQLDRPATIDCRVLLIRLFDRPQHIAISSGAQASRARRALHAAAGSRRPSHPTATRPWPPGAIAAWQASE